MSQTDATAETNCPHCLVTLEVPLEMMNEEVECPSCSQVFVVQLPAQEMQTRTCVQCDAALDVDAVICIVCGTDQRTGKSINSEIAVNAFPRSTQVDSEAPARRRPLLLWGGIAAAGVVLIAAGTFITVTRHAGKQKSAVTVSDKPSKGQDAKRPGKAQSPMRRELLYDEERHPAKVKKPLPWRIPAGFALIDCKVGNSIENRPIAVAGDYVAYSCISGQVEKIFINGNEIASLKTHAPFSQVVFSRNLKHWIGQSMISQTLKGKLLVDGHEIYEAERGFAVLLISDDGRFVAAGLLTGGVYFNGVVRPEYDMNNLILVGPSYTPFYGSEGDWVFGTQRWKYASFPLTHNSLQHVDTLSCLVQEDDGKRIWIDGVAHDKFDEIPSGIAELHPVSKIYHYLAKRNSFFHFIFDGKSYGPFKTIRGDRGYPKISRDGAHFAFRGEQLGRTVLIHDGREVVYNPDVLMGESFIIPSIDDSFYLSPDGLHVYEVAKGDNRRQYIVIDGVPVEMSEKYATFDAVSFVLPHNKLAYAKRGLVTCGGVVLGELIKAVGVNAGTTAYMIRKQVREGSKPGSEKEERIEVPACLVHNEREVITGLTSGMGQTQFLASSNGNHWAYILKKDGPSYAVVCEKGEGPTLERPPVDRSLIFSPDGSRVAYLAENNSSDLFVGIDNLVGPAFKRTDKSIAIPPTFSDDSKYCYYELRENKTGGQSRFYVNQQSSVPYTRRLSNPVAEPDGVGIYVLEGNQIVFLKP